MDTLFISALTVSLAELGDKTQLLSLLLTAKFKNKSALILGIFLATLLNHGLSSYFGHYIATFFNLDWAHWVLGLSFIIVGLWLLFPDKEEGIEHRFDGMGAFITSFVLFFLAEIGDKTQIATVLLGAQYQSIVLVTIGTTLGMLLANVPVVYFGNKLMQKLPLKQTRLVAAILFVLLGLFSLLNFNQSFS